MLTAGRPGRRFFPRGGPRATCAGPLVSGYAPWTLPERPPRATALQVPNSSKIFHTRRSPNAKGEVTVNQPTTMGCGMLLRDSHTYDPCGLRPLWP